MNRVLLYLDSLATRRKRKKEVLNSQMESIEQIAGSVLWLSLEDGEEGEGEPAICWRIGDYREGANSFHPEFNHAEAIAELRAFAAECLEAATKLEGGVA